MIDDGSILPSVGFTTSLPSARPAGEFGCANDGDGGGGGGDDEVRGQAPDDLDVLRYEDEDEEEEEDEEDDEDEDDIEGRDTQSTRALIIVSHG